MKISEDYKAFGGEIHIQRRVFTCNKKRPQKFLSTPEVVDYGLINIKHQDEDALLAYAIMPRYGMNLEHAFRLCELQFSKAAILNIGIAVIALLKRVHRAGYVYNDLKLDNLMFGFG